MVLAMLAGALLVLVIQGLGARWDRQAQAASIDELARSAVARLIESVPWSGGEKIRGVAGLGDGRTFIVYSDDTIRFYQFAGPTGQLTP
ncbi:hypothetical protein AMJ85_08355 [candidate division BRC1 bacterium SM23_51]|nr:MAG: hypothetical protein AMJ85_08355 [candidate division BRC1 bacterium SM23_51]